MEAIRNFRSVGRKIVCVGRNYGAHAAELGNPVPKKPMLFMKATSSYITEGQAIQVPTGCQNLSQEVELGVIVGQRATRISKADAMNYVGGYAVALDMTARDFQDEAKKEGAPWFLAKSFDSSCPVSDFVPKEKVADPHKLRLWCNINGVEKQNATTDNMIFDIPTLLEYITQYVTLEPGDMVLTGTPAGVARVQSGDLIECGFDDIVSMSFKVQ